MTACVTCKQIAVMEAGDDPYAIARTGTGYLQLERLQYHPGYCIFHARSCVRELYELDGEELHHQIDEMVSLAEAIARAFRSVKMNYEALGNTPGGHLHWHLVPRHADDPHLSGPIWRDAEFMRLLKSGDGGPTESERRRLQQRLKAEIERRPVTIEQWYV
jgi:diadenosine tetraphosphate (Ap4A) HIT family hydrolase